MDRKKNSDFKNEKIFFCKSFDKFGKVHKSIIRSHDKSEIAKKLYEKGEFLSFQIIIPKNIFKFYKPDVVNFFQYIKYQFKIGIDLISAIDNFIYMNDSLFLKYHILKIKDDLLNGFSFAESVRDIVDDFIYSFLKSVGENGNFIDSIDYVIKYLTLRCKFKKNLFSKLKYPVFCFLFVVLIVSLIVNFIVPTIENFLNIQNVNFVIASYEAVLVFFVIYYAILGCTKKYILKDFLIGNFVKDLNMVIFSENFLICLKSNLNVLLAFKMSLMSLKNQYLKEIFMKILKNVHEGGSFYESMLKFSDFIPKWYISLVKISEENNKFLEVFEKNNELMQAEIQNRIQKISDNLVILINLLSGIFLITVLFLIIGPLYDITDQIELM